MSTLDGERLLSQIVQCVFKLYPQISKVDLEVQLSKVISKYKVSKIEKSNTQIDIHNKIDLYLSGKQLEGLSKTTIDNYKIQLRVFGNEVKKNVAEITTSDIRVYLGKYSHQKVSTISTKLSVLKSFFSWLTSEEFILKDPTTKINPPKKEQRLPKALLIEELELLRESCTNNRQRALVEVIYATGCRLSEIRSLNRIDIDYQSQNAHVIGKGNKEREVLFSFKALYHLKKYLMNREDDCPALFATKRHPYRRLSVRAIQREIEIIAEKAGLQKKVTPHTLRHTFATLSLNNGADLVTIQHLLGHSNPATTQIYATLSDERKREQYRRYLVQ